MITNDNTLNKSKGILKKILIFLIFELVFSALTMPILIFYGPFENIKRTVVGASYYTLRHQYIANFFLSDDAIIRILAKNAPQDTIDDGSEVIQKITINNNHDQKIEVCNIDGGTFNGKLMTIYDPTRVVIGYSSQMPKAGETTSAISKKSSAVAGINAGGFMDTNWSGTGGAPMGFLIHNKKIVYNQLKSEATKQDTVAITEDGMLIVGKHSIDQLKLLGVKEGVSFGPPLIVNGKATIKSGDGGWGIAPRTVIGQTANGTILFLTIDGRSIKSIGGTLRDAQDILLSYKVVNASNLDGGSSTTMFYNGKVINTPSDALGERAVPSVFMVLPVE